MQPGWRTGGPGSSRRGSGRTAGLREKAFECVDAPAQHIPVGGAAGRLELCRQVGQAEREALDALAALQGLGREGGARRRPPRGLGLLVLDRLALPPARHRKTV